MDANSPATRALLPCGLVSSLLYAAMDVAGVLSSPGYDPRAQTISELSAIGAPTASLLAPLQTLYSSLLALFGAAVWMIAGRRQSLRWCGGFIIGVAALGIGWALFPMHRRGAARTASDTMHLMTGGLTVALLLGAIASGAKALGRGFRLYSAATAAVMLLFGALTSTAAPRLDAGLETPWMGVHERIMMASWLLWMAILSLVLRQRDGRTAAA